MLGSAEFITCKQKWNSLRKHKRKHHIFYASKPQVFYMDIISFTFNSIAVAVIVFATVAVAFTVCNVVLGCIGNKVIHGKSIMNTDKIYRSFRSTTSK